MATHPPFAQAGAPPVPGLLDLYIGFLLIGIQSVGGALPWARRMIVERRRWLTPEEFNDVLALCQFLPGPNIVNVSIAFGGRCHGVRGALAAVVGLMGIPMMIAIALGVIYAQVADSAAVNGALGGVAAAAAGVILATAAKIVAPLIERRRATPILFALAAFIGVGVMRWPLWIVIAVLAPLSVAASWRRRWTRRRW
jgi:chromate transporter